MVKSEPVVKVSKSALKHSTRVFPFYTICFLYYLSGGIILLLLDYIYLTPVVTSSTVD